MKEMQRPAGYSSCANEGWVVAWSMTGMQPKGSKWQRVLTGCKRYPAGYMPALTE
ncbi:MAG: hypothetical protein JST70_13665 [Bacteroidetes bacterium]|nr:hypothetical protein [Bacteroidota bacterium]